MENLRKNKTIIFVCIFLLLSVFILVLSLNKEYEKVIDEENYVFLKNYKSNEFVPVYMSEEDIVKVYLNDYKNNMLYDIDRAYLSLNKEYREKRFKDLDSFKKYIESIRSNSSYSMEVEKYSVSIINGNKIFKIYDKSGYKYYIKEKSIMDYEVYLDEYTIDF